MSTFLFCGPKLFTGFLNFLSREWRVIHASSLFVQIPVLFLYFFNLFFPNISVSYTVRCQTMNVQTQNICFVFSILLLLVNSVSFVVVVFLSVTFILCSSVQQTSFSLIELLLALVVLLPLGIHSISSRYKSSLSPDLIWQMCMFVFSHTLLSFILSSKSHSTIMSGFIT